jgi:hypothetical protein
MKTEIPYSNREQDTKHNELLSYLQRIEAQTTKTNGRVTSLEWWRQFTLGATTVFFIFISTVLGLSIYIYKNDHNAKEIKIQQILDNQKPITNEYKI